MSGGPQWVSVSGYEALKAELGREDWAGKDVFVLFCGGTDPSTGESWCPDCVTAQPVVDAVAKEKLSPEQIFVHCDVGDRSAWKNPQNPFRTDKDLKLSGVPTLLNIAAPQNRLVEEKCLSKDLIAMLFEE